jgi:hypothetical protein
MAKNSRRLLETARELENFGAATAEAAYALSTAARQCADALRALDASDRAKAEPIAKKMTKGAWVRRRPSRRKR